MRRVIAGGLLALLIVCNSAAQAEVKEVTVASTIGLAQFPGRVVYELHLIEKRAESLGVPDLKVSFQEVTSGNVVSQLVLAGRANVGISGNVPMFYLWDKTNGRIKGMTALSQGGMFLVTCDPRLKSLHDYSDNDRIAMTGLKTTTYAMLLQMEAAKEFGWNNRNRFDKISVAMADPEGMGAILSCKTNVKTQMTILPQSTLELASSKDHVVFSSEQLLGHSYTFNVAFATTEFKRDNPKVYEAIVEAFGDAIKFVKDNPEKAAYMYVKDEPFIGTRETAVKLIKGETPDHFSYTQVPKSTKAFMDFMSIRND